MMTNGKLTLYELRRQTEAELARAGIASARFEANQLVSAVCGDEPSGNELVRLSELITRRINGEPLQYLLGEWEFYGLTLKTDPRALIPRADTETLIDVALDFLKNKTEPRIIDLCSGTGCIAIAIAKYSNFAVTAVEKYENALSLLKDNIALYGVPVTPVPGDITEAPTIYRHYDLIVSNPPYIKSGDLSSLKPELKFEPQAALDGGSDGLDFYRALTKHWVPALNNDGMMAVEAGLGQHEQVAAMFKEAGLRDIRFYKDLLGIIRVISGLK